MLVCTVPATLQISSSAFYIYGFCMALSMNSNYLKFRVFWDILSYSQTDVDIDLTTRQYIAEDSELHTRRSENLKSHIAIIFFKSVKKLMFLMVKCCVLFEVRPELLNVIYKSFAY
jgi:hypothetical protein